MDRPRPETPMTMGGQVGNHHGNDRTWLRFLPLLAGAFFLRQVSGCVQTYEELKAEVKKLAKLVKKPTDDPPFPPIPTVPTLLGSLQKLQKLPPQPSSFVPFIEKFDPSVLQQLQSTITNQGGNRNGKIPGKPGVDYPDFKTIPATDFSCENFILEGFYADTFTSCQVCTAVHTYRV